MNRFDRDRFDQMGKEALSRVEELMNSSRINELLHKREEDEKKKNCILALLIIEQQWVLHMELHTLYKFSFLYLIIWKILKMISMMILTMTSLRMRSLRKRRQKRLNSRGCLKTIIRYTVRYKQK